MSSIPRQQLEHLRVVSRNLLRLHKLLLDLERARYEHVHGPISGPGEFLNLVLAHAQFEWLRQLSGLIVRIDETAAPRAKAGPDDAAAALQAVRELLVPSEDGSDFQRKYWRSIQDSPDIVFARREIAKLL